jgi:hypothetical protein
MLPKPDWLTLSASVPYIANATGAEPEEAKSALKKAIRDGRVLSRARCKSYTGHDTQTTMNGVAWDQCTVHWDDDRFESPNGYSAGRKGVHLFTDVEILRVGNVGIDHWLQVPPTKNNPKNLDTRERETLQMIVAALAYDGYGYDPAQKTSPFPAEVVGMITECLGEDRHIDTVRKHLKAAAVAFPRTHTEVE